MYPQTPSHSTLTYPPLADVIWQNKSLLRNLLLAVAGSILLYLSAKIKVPFYPVPITMQTFVVLVIGMAYGWRLGAATVLLYLLEGASGLPVFAGTPEKGIGLAYMTGPTGGYLVGFVVAAGVCGWLAERGWDRNWLTTIAAMLLGNLIVYLLGVAWLGNLIGIDKALQFGLYPFLWGDLAKIVLAMIALPFAWKLVKKRT